MVTVRKERRWDSRDCSKDRWQALPVLVLVLASASASVTNQACLAHVTAVISKLLQSTPQLMIL